MGAALLAIAAALIGGGVSLASVLLSQRGAERAQNREQHRIDQRRAEDRLHDWDSRLLDERRAAYTRLNSTARSLRDALSDCRHGLEATGTLNADVLEEMEERWNQYVVTHAEAHMIVSDGVLPLLGAVNGSLRIARGLVKQLSGERQRPGGELEQLTQRIADLWPRLEALRDEMRRDLGVTSR
ncbi:hypothetical protein [Streptomyces sp. MI02-7b]|uniref:hypothetical protein n=1 Tax=Streptomyces sp. MI02-7b TaxID=462941 RepID=UPI0029A4C403|nr:hypothetical protein [Streptomyces sp. MI02-7b]MDX3077895.1 hypothetical protein [Streptomyces sp. MI02-7b]